MSDRIAQFKQEASDYSSRVLSDTSMMSEEDYKLLEYSLNKEWSNPKFKMRWFVGETQITPFSKVRQWILEIKSREEAIENLEYEIKKYQVQVDRHLHIAEHSDNEFDRRESQIEADELTRTQIMTKRRLVNWYLERQQIIDLVNEFNESPEALLPDGSGRTYMDIMDTDEEDIYEAEFWTNRLAKQAATDLLFYGRVGTGNMDAILSMAPEHQTQTLTLAMSYGTQLQKINENIQLQVDETLSLGDKSDNAFLTTPLSLQEATQKLTMDTKSATAGPVGDDILNVYNK
jgi:hypothetical protein|tara:strand:+ start:378 stop:1244 length:867 start_codon:yes stop_codon:yes gene_type:complete